MTWNGWRVLVACLLAALGSSTVSIIYSNDAARQSERRVSEQQRVSEQKWCDLVTAWDDTYKARPPSTPTGQDLAAKLSRLRDSFHCPGDR